MRHPLFVLVGIAVLSLVGVGQEQQTFRTATRLVEVSVIVTTGHGRPITGLTQQDFTLKEDGKIQPVSFFEARDMNTPGRREVSAFRVPNAPNTFSNIAPSASGMSTVLLLDRTNTAYDNQWYAKRQIDRYFAAMRPGERVALYVLDGTIRVLHDFTDNVDLLRRSLDAYHASVTGHYAASTEPAPPSAGSWLADPNLSMSEFFMQRRSIESFEMLEFLADNLGGIPGRKNLVWVSEVFPIPTGIDRPWVLEMMHRANRALSNAHVSVYPVDARGLVGAYQTINGRMVGFTSHLQVRGNIETMEVVAEETGGRAYANTNALDHSIARAVDDSRVSYSLGYYPASAANDRRFRRIDVNVNRQGAHVRHRLGYFTVAPTNDKEVTEKATRNTLESPLQSSGVGVAATATRSGDSVAFSIRIDPSTVTLQRKDDRWHAAVDVLVAQVDAHGRGVVEATIPVALSLTEAERTRLLTDGIPVEKTFVPKPGATEFRILARDGATANVGSLVIQALQIK